MILTQNEKKVLERWIYETEAHAAHMNNEWLKGLYSGEAMAYKVILCICAMQESD